MRLIYLESTIDDLSWLRRYYEEVFPEGRENAQKQFHSIETLLVNNPRVGHVTHQENVFEFSIPKTPFSYIYRVQPDRIEVLRVWDERRGLAD